MRGVMPNAQAEALLAKWKIDGAIASLLSEDAGPWLASLGVPVVNVSGRYHADYLPRVANDDHAIGILAAEYLLSKQFSSFAFLGSATDVYAERRYQSFSRRITLDGRQVISYRGSSLDPDDDAPLAKWLKTLTRGTAIFAADDRWAVRASEVAREVDLNIPEQFAILGVDDDDMCLMTYPPLSSIRTPGEQIGFEAARVLDQLLAGKAAPKAPLLFPPLDVHERGSTEVGSIVDPDIATAVRFIREHACEQINVESVSQAVAISRRHLELGFQRALARTPLSEIRRVRLEQAKRLLAETDLKVAQIADACGFSSAQRLSVVFFEQEKETPTAYRRRTRYDQ